MLAVHATRRASAVAATTTTELLRTRAATTSAPPTRSGYELKAARIDSSFGSRAEEKVTAVKNADPQIAAPIPITTMETIAAATTTRHLIRRSAPKAKAGTNTAG